MYLPKNAIVFESPRSNTKRYEPPTRTSASQESRDMPIDFGTHRSLIGSGWVHASNTRRAGASKVRVTTKPELIKLWWVPKSMGMSLLSCEADVRVGGSYRFVFDLG